MVDKQPQSTSKEIQAVLQTQDAEQLEFPLLTQKHKKARLEFAKM